MNWDDPLPWFLLVTLCALAVRSITADRRLRVRIDALGEKLATLDQRLFGIDEHLASAGIQAPSAALDTSAGLEATLEMATPEARASQSAPQAPVAAEPAAAVVVAPAAVSVSVFIIC